VVGGTRKGRIRKYSARLTVLILSRLGRLYKEDFLEELGSLDRADVLCVEGPGRTYDLEARARKFPTVRFLLLEEDVTVGEKINLGVEESASPYVFVVWSDMRIPRSTIGVELMERLGSAVELCRVPLLKSGKGDIIPSLQVPGFLGKELKVVPWKTVTEGSRSLFPFDYCGIYDRERFVLLGGYDAEILSPYWQKMDFGFRSCLWGEKIIYDPSIALSYLVEIPSDNTTPDAGYKPFYLKNLAVRHRRGGAVLPWLRFPAYMVRSDTGPLYAWKEFRAAGRWVRRHRHRYVMDGRALVTNWKQPE
jgi:hypothetical protein